MLESTLLSPSPSTVSSWAQCKIGRCPLRFRTGASCLQMLLDHERMVHASFQPPIMAEEYHDEDQDEAQYILSCLLWSFQLLISFYVVILFSLCSCVGLQFVVK